MRTMKKIMLLTICFIMALILKGKTVFAKSVIQVVPNVEAWNNIKVSDAYDTCQDLNADYSTLGTDKLKAHLTTNADWYAVSLLAYSDYGDTSASNTTGNKTGIINFGTKYTFTSSVMEGTSTNENTTSLYNNIGTQYVESVKNNTNRALNELGRGLLSNEMLSGSLGKVYYSTKTSYPVSVRNSLFGFSLGSPMTGGFGQYDSSNGGSYSNVTFRPVIWNK